VIIRLCTILILLLLLLLLIIIIIIIIIIITRKYSENANLGLASIVNCVGRLKVTD